MFISGDDVQNYISIIFKGPVRMQWLSSWKCINQNYFSEQIPFSSPPLTSPSSSLPVLHLLAFLLSLSLFSPSFLYFLPILPPSPSFSSFPFFLSSFPSFHYFPSIPSFPSFLPSFISSFLSVGTQEIHKSILPKFNLYIQVNLFTCSCILLLNKLFLNVYYVWDTVLVLRL